MSHYTYAGEFKNPTEGWYVKQVGEKFEVWLHFAREEDGSAPPDRKHTSAPSFDEADEAEDWIEGTREFFEEDFDAYLEENHDDIVRQERYEDWRNER